MIDGEIIVQKYGGSSVADLERIGAVAEKVMATARVGKRVVVVVSAMGKTTDALVAQARLVDPEPPCRELDMLVSTGERVSMALLSIAIQKRGGESISFTGSQAGILTDDRHFDARIVAVRPHRVREELEKGRIVIVAGYQGVSAKKEITTLGRGGSDTTAVALAAALGAERCEIYSDVDGIYSADPRVVADARHLPEIDHATLQVAADAGAKVLNAQAVEWARRAGIEIHARHSAQSYEGREAVGGARQTVVRTSIASSAWGDAGERGPARALVVGERRLALLRVRGGDPLGDLGRACAHAGVVARDVSVDLDGGLGDGLTGDGGGGRAMAVFSLLNLPDWSRSRRALLDALGDRGVLIMLIEDVAAATVVGDGLTAVGAPFGGARLADIAAGIGAPLYGASFAPLRATLFTDDRRLDDVVRALHAELVRV